MSLNTIENQPKPNNHNKLKNGAIIAGIFSVAAVGSMAGVAVSRGIDTGNGSRPTPTPTELPSGAPKPSEAAGTPNPTSSAEIASPSASALASAEASNAPEFVSIKDGSIGGDTIIKLPANTVITGDPFFFGGQPGNGQQLEDFTPNTFPVEQIGSQSLVGGQTLGDSDPSTGGVWILQQDLYLQSATSYGFSFNTFKTAAEAEKFAIGQQFVTKNMGCGVQADGQKGCQRVDIMHVPGEKQGPNGPESLNGTAVTTPTASLSLDAIASNIPNLGINNPTNPTKDQEIAFIEGVINSGKVDMNSDTGKILAQILYCLECSSSVCTNPAVTPAATPAPSSSPEVCVPTQKDIVQPAGYTFDTKGQSIIIQGAAKIDGVNRFTPGNDSTKVKQIDVLADGKNHHVTIVFPSDVQYFNGCADKTFISNTYNHDKAQDNRIIDSKSINLQ